MLEAVFRYQLAHNGSGGTATGRVTHYYFALGKYETTLDPPTALISRFADHDPAVLPASFSEASARRVTHKDLGGRGVLLHIDRIRPINADTFDVDGGYFENGLSASGNTYRIRRHGDSWEVVGDAMWWIS